MLSTTTRSANGARDRLWSCAAAALYAALQQGVGWLGCAHRNQWCMLKCGRQSAASAQPQQSGRWGTTQGTLGAQS
jgi:hypothetical protein